MKHNWEYKRLGDVCEIKTGKLDANAKDENGLYPFFTCDAKPYRINTYAFDDEAILISGNGSHVGHVHYYNGKFNAYQRTYVLTKFKFYKPNFLTLFLHGFLRPYIFERKKGGCIPFITLPILTNFKIPYPPQNMQEQIVAELDAINKGITELREQVKDLDTLAQTLFYETFGDPISNPKAWQKKEFNSSVIEMFLGPFGSALKTECYVPEEQSFAMVYEQKHAIKGTINQENHFIDEAKFNSLKRFEVLPNDFIMSCRGTIGKLYQVPQDAPRGIIHPSLMKIRLNNSYKSTFFKFLLPIIINNESTKGNCVQMAITSKELGKKLLIVPPLALQQQFAEQIEEIEKMKRELEAQIADAQTLLDSRMDYWFN